ncbi:MAG: superoxide dismutase family protein [Bacteroidota bacterium]
MRTRFVLISSFLLSIIIFTAGAQMKHGSDFEAGPTKAIAVLHPTKGSSVSGIVTFEKTDKGVHVMARITGLTPGKHGFHIHEYGDCSADNGTSAGGHFNPAGMPHSGPMMEKRHVGDMGNLEADKDGNAKLDYVDPLITLTGPHAVIGYGVIVHEKEDDLKSQPTGDAGGRLACGVVGVMKK